MSQTSMLKDRVLEEVGAVFVTTSYDLGEKASFKYPEHFSLFQFKAAKYNVEGLGNMAVLEGHMKLGMDLLTFVFTPQIGRNIPFVIIDFVRLKKKLTVFVEFYTQHLRGDKALVSWQEKMREKQMLYGKVENYYENPHWYVPLRAGYSPLKQGTLKEQGILEEMVIDYLKTYLAAVKEGPFNKMAKEHTKNQVLEDFLEDLIYKGNPSSNILEKALGRQEAENFFRTVIFAYQ